jgi:hypothetical protein
MWRIWTVVPRWKAVLSLVILDAALLWLYYHEDKKLDPDFVMYILGGHCRHHAYHGRGYVRLGTFNKGNTNKCSEKI